MCIIYTLKLKENKYYIGKTTSITERLNAHFYGHGSEWTKKYPPDYVIEKIVNTDYFTELGVTLRYMKRYGIDNVRGSVYSSIFLSQVQIQEITKHIRSEDNLCLQCGSDMHFSKYCTADKEISFFKKILNFFTICKKKESVNFGKYKGYSYREIYEGDNRYCKWIKNTNSNNPELNKFKKWLIEKEQY